MQRKTTPKREKRYKEIESEQIKEKFENTIITSNQGYKVRLNKYYNCYNCELEFLNVKYPYKVNIEFRSFKNKTVQYPYHPTKFGVGFIGEGIYKTSHIGKDNLEYTYWDGFMRRCYSNRVQNIRKTYIGCSTEESWHNFQVFGDWFQENYKSEYMQSWCLDKDLLIKGNKDYSPETCCFLPNEINILFTNGYSKRGKYPKGVSYKPRINKYIAQYQKEGMVKHIGTYKTVEEAFQAYKSVKEQYIKNKADKWKDKIDSRAYTAMYNYTIEITD